MIGRRPFLRLTGGLALGAAAAGVLGKAAEAKVNTSLFAPANEVPAEPGTAYVRWFEPLGGEWCALYPPAEPQILGLGSPPLDT